MTKQIIAVDDAAPGACVDVGMVFNGTDTVTASNDVVLAGATTISGATTLSGTTNVTGDVTINTNKATITASSGSIATTGTITAGLTGHLNGGIDVNSKASIEKTNGDIVTAGDITALTGRLAIGSDAAFGDAVSFGANTVSATSGAKVVSVTNLMSCYTTNSTADIDASLADGVDGQIKIVKLILKDTNNLVLTPANFGDGSTITLDATGEIAVLVFVDSDWQVVYTTGTVA